MSANPTVQIQPSGNMQIFIPMILKRKSGRRMVIAPNAVDGAIPEAESKIQAPLVQAIVRSRMWNESLDSDRVSCVSALSRKLRLDNSFVTRMLKLTFLAPDITVAILNGEEPDGLSLSKLLKPLPDDWDEQREVLGFRG